MVVHRNTPVPIHEYYEKYHDMKERYKYWVDLWPESTDPKKFVYEEMSIAAFLICMFKKEREVTGSTK